MSQSYEKKGYLMEDFLLFHLRDVQGTDTDYHYHEFYKILFLISGSGGYSIEGKRYLLKSGDIVLVGKHCVHRPEFEKGLPYERVILYISPDFLKRQSTVDCDLTDCFLELNGPVFRPDEREGKKMIRLLSALENELSGNEYGSSIVSNSILLHILIEIMRNFRHGQGESLSPITPNSKRMLEIVKYLDAHLTENISIEELSEKFYLSRFHMMRRFKEETGTTIHNYISDRRLLLARDMISNGHAATDACFLSGFQSYASFSRAYGKLFGTTPTGRKISSASVEGTYE